MKQELSHKCTKKKPYQNKTTVDGSRACPEYPYCAPTQSFKLHVSQPGETIPTYTLKTTLFQSSSCTAVEVPLTREMFCATTGPLTAWYFLEIHV